MEQNNDDLRNRFTAWMQVVVKRAKIDGMGFWKIFFTIILPLSKPALIAQFIFGFVAGYNNYTGALLYLNNASEDLWTLQIALQKLIAYLSGSGDYNFLCATALMAMLPLIVVYIACQKFFVQGITFGGGKE
ncbi:MAG: ABC transporter permease subunit [Clostridiales bacterium]|nr:ABC transporter permease subunit [Clostridiales bacterium]